MNDPSTSQPSVGPSGRDPSPATGRRTMIVRLAGTLIALVLLIYLLTQQGWEEIAGAFNKIGVCRLALATALMLVSRLAVSARWYALLQASGVKMPLGQSMRITFAGLFANNFLPTTIGGDVIRLAAAVRLCYDAPAVTASLIVDRLVGMAGMAMTLPLGLPRFLEVRHRSEGFLALKTVAPAGWLPVPLSGWLTKAREKAQQAALRTLKALALCLKIPRSLLMGLVYTWMHMLCLFFVITLLFDGMGESLSFWLIAGLYSMVYFVTLLPVSINGYGLQEISMTLIFSTLGGASRTSGLTAALLFRTLLMIASLPGALFVPEILSGKKNQPLL